MLSKICLLTNYNLYESKRHFTQKLAEALNRQQIETKIVDAKEGPIGAEIISAIQKFEPDLTCSFNSMLPLSENRYLWDLLEIPHLSILVDPAIYSVSLTASPYSILSCVDRQDCLALQEYEFDRIFFWPHAVERELGDAPKQTKDLDVVFLGSCYDYESLRASWQQRNPEALNGVLDDAIDLVFSNNQISLADALVMAWNRSGHDHLGVDFTTLFYYLDMYTRGKDRVELIRSIKDVPVHIYGELSQDNAVGVLGWPQYLANQSNVTIHPSVPFPESFDILRRSKISLNSMPFFRDGTHERVFTSLCCGTVPITSESAYLRESFKEGQHVHYYQSKHWNDVNEKIHALLHNESKRQEMADLGKALVLKAHTWDKRVEQLKEILPPLINK
jgi:glycosyltransferase involved in cell wall biosynthesis